MGKGKLIVIEGLDFAGKSTQLELLRDEIQKRGNNNVYIGGFPNYAEESSVFVREYLRGAYPTSVDAKTVATFYGLDRYSTYHTKGMKEVYESGGLVILDRYTTSNIVHQGSKCAKAGEVIDFIEWIENYEYNTLGLPRPDRVIFLATTLELVAKMRKTRELDVLERDWEYVKRTHTVATDIVRKLGWEMVEVAKVDEYRERFDIFADIMQIIDAELTGTVLCDRM